MMAKQYHMLPSEIVARASTYDLAVFNSLMTWEQEQQDKASGKKTAPKLSLDTMKAMLEQVRKDR